MGRGPGVRATGAKSIQIDFRYQGIRCRERLRLAPTAQNLKYAARLKATIEHEIAIGTFEYARHFPESTRAQRLAGRADATVILREALRAYCASLRGSVEPETLRDYGRDAEIVARWFDKDRTLGSLTRKDIRQAVAKQALSRTRISNLLRPLRGALEQALEDEAIADNPLHGFKIRRAGSIPKQEVDPFTPEEVEALAQYGDIWTFWAWTGLRSGEVIGLLWSDVAGECESVTVRRAVRLGRAKAPKTAAGVRVLRILAPARAALLRARAAGDFDIDQPVFRNPVTGRGWHEAKALNRAFARACRKAKVRRRYVYQLRHTFATWALSSGENPAWIAKQMGHKNVQVIFDHYAKWMGELDSKAGSRMVGAVESKATRGPRAA
jgi:integrase